jgi:hypothetical protein
MHFQMALTGTFPNATAAWEELLALRQEADGYKVWGLVSHVSFIVQIAIGAHWRSGITVVVSLAALLLSLGYHTCLSYDVCTGIGIEEWRRNDHFSAMLEVTLLLSYFIVMHDHAVSPRVAAVALEPEEYERLRHGSSHDAGLADHDEGDMGGPLNPPRSYVQWTEIFFFVSVLFAGLVNYNWPLDDLFPFYIVLVTGLLGWLLFVVFRMEHTPPLGDGSMFMIAPTVPNWPAFAAFVVLGALAVTFFVLPEATSSFFHSWWHFFAPLAVSAAFLSVVLDPLEGLFITWVAKQSRRRQRRGRE